MANLYILLIFVPLILKRADCLRTVLPPFLKKIDEREEEENFERQEKVEHGARIARRAQRRWQNTFGQRAAEEILNVNIPI